MSIHVAWLAFAAVCAAGAMTLLPQPPVESSEHRELRALRAELRDYVTAEERRRTHPHLVVDHDTVKTPVWGSDCEVVNAGSEASSFVRCEAVKR